MINSLPAEMSLLAMKHTALFESVHSLNRSTETFCFSLLEDLAKYLAKHDMKNQTHRHN
jgi:hypothetical protein